MPKEEVTTTVKGCARCRRRHNKLTFKPLTYPITVDHLRFTHWAPCPNNGEPILMTKIAKP